MGEVIRMAEGIGMSDLVVAVMAGLLGLSLYLGWTAYLEDKEAKKCFGLFCQRLSILETAVDFLVDAIRPKDTEEKDKEPTDGAEGL